MGDHRTMTMTIVALTMNMTIMGATTTLLFQGWLFQRCCECGQCPPPPPLPWCITFADPLGT